MGLKPEFVEQIAERRATLRAMLAILFPKPRPVVWEIGCGHGHFLTRYATVFAQKFCVGVDLRRARIDRGWRKAGHARLANCNFVLAEAREFLLALPPGVTFEEIWVLFPDPWPKKRHHKNRLLQPDFFEAIAGRSEPGARLYFRTDYGTYFRQVEAFLPSLHTWRTAPLGEGWPLEHETVFQARAASFHSLVAIRTSHPARPIEIFAPGLPPPISPTSPA